VELAAGPLSPRFGRGAVLAWREALARALERDLEWDEDAPGARATVDPEAWESLQVLAALDDGGGRAPAAAVGDARAERAWRRAAARPHGRSTQLYHPRLWLPLRFGEPVQAVDPAREPVTIGSSIELLEQLERLAARAPATETAFSRAAHAALGALTALAEQAVERRLPLAAHATAS
jgi:hypothetical protein